MGRALNPALQTFEQWLAVNADRIPQMPSPGIGGREAPMRMLTLYLAACLPPLPDRPPPATPPPPTSPSVVLQPPTSAAGPEPTCDTTAAPTGTEPPPIACTREADYADWSGGLVLRLEAGEVLPGVPLVLTATGADPGDRVTFHLGSACGFSCPEDLDGGCFQPGDAAALGDDVADGAGVATIEVTPDAMWENRWLVLQATIDDRRALSQALVDRVGSWWEPLLEADPEIAPMTLRRQFGYEEAWWRVSPGRALAVTYDSEQQSDNLSTLTAASDGDVFVWDAFETPPLTWFPTLSRWTFEAYWDYGYAVAEWDLDLQIVPLEAPVAWYPDLDGDGAGDPNAPAVVSAVAVPDASPDGRDCDDTDPAVGPFGAEVCDDGVDQDCDGADRSCTGPPFEDAGTQLMGSSGAGTALVPFLAPFAGFAEPLLVVPGWPSGVFAVSRADQHAPVAQIDASVAAGGDLTGDGTADLVLVDDLEIFLLEGPVSPDATPADAVFHCETSLITEQLAVADITGDGEPDLIGGPWPYAADLNWLEGPLTSPSGDRSGSLGYQSQSAGFALTDADGDGLSDLWSTALCLYLSPLPPSGAVAAGCVQGLSAREQGRAGLPAAADLDGDGRGDLIAGFAETVWLVTGPLSGDSRLADTWGHIEAGGDLSWGSVSAVPDRDGDGTGEVVVSTQIDVWMMPFQAGVSVRADGDLLAPGSGHLLPPPVFGGDLDGDGSGDVYYGTPDRSFADQRWASGGTILWGESP